MKKTLQDVFNLWEASAEKDSAKQSGKSWQDGEPEGKKLAVQEVPHEKVASYNKPKPVQLRKGNDGWNQGGGPSGWNTLEKKVKFVPGDDKDKNAHSLQQDKLHQLEEELAALGVQEEGLITPDMGTSVLGRSLFTGAALQPPNGYGPNFDPAGPAPEELPQGYEKNTVPDSIAPEEGSGFQHQDVAGTILAPRQWIPREGLLEAKGPLSMGQLNALALLIKKIPGVMGVKIWDKAPGKERLYVDLVSKQSSAYHSGGTVVVDGNTGKAVLSDDGWLGAKTREWHNANETIAKIRAARDEVLSALSDSSASSELEPTLSTDAPLISKESKLVGLGNVRNRLIHHIEQARRTKLR